MCLSCGSSQGVLCETWNVDVAEKGGHTELGQLFFLGQTPLFCLLEISTAVSNKDGSIWRGIKTIRDPPDSFLRGSRGVDFVCWFICTKIEKSSPRVWKTWLWKGDGGLTGHLWDPGQSQDWWCPPLHLSDLPLSSLFFFYFFISLPTRRANFHAGNWVEFAIKTWWAFFRLFWHLSFLSDHKPWELLSSWEWGVGHKNPREEGGGAELLYLHMASPPADPLIYQCLGHNSSLTLCFPGFCSISMFCFRRIWKIEPIQKILNNVGTEMQHNFKAMQN